MPGHWQLREPAGAYVNGNGRCLNVSNEPARCNRSAANAKADKLDHANGFAWFRATPTVTGGTGSLCAAKVFDA